KIATTYPKSVHYLKCGNTTVSTKPQKTWADLFSQRMRWAAKTSAYNTVFAKLTGLIVLLMNVLFVMALLLFLFNSFNTKIVLYMIVIKLYLDFLLIYKTAAFFNQKHLFKSYLLGF